MRCSSVADFTGWALPAGFYNDNQSWAQPLAPYEWHHDATAKTLIGGDMRGAYAKHLAWYTGQYAPKCNKSPSVSAQPNGAAYYNYRIRQMTTTTRTADEIHELGLAEVKRIRSEMEEVKRRSGLGEHYERLVASYSQGMRARLGLAVIERTEPTILLPHRSCLA